LLADTGFDRRVWQTVAERMASDVALSPVDPPGWRRSDASLTPDHWPMPRRPASAAGR
jgi:hypothetical protein